MSLDTDREQYHNMTKICDADYTKNKDTNLDLNPDLSSLQLELISMFSKME